MPRASTSSGAPARLRFALVALAAFLAYVRTIPFELVWDDLLLQEYVRTLVAGGGLERLLTAEFLLGSGSAPTGYYRPVALFSLWVDDLLSSGAYDTYHLTNILLHTANSCLVLLSLDHFLRSFPAAADPAPDAGADAARSGRAALFGALVFAVHPMHVESVAFVSGRTDLLAAAFVLLHLISWMRVRSGRSSHPAAERFWCLLTLTAAALSKELAVLLPAVLLCWDLLAPRDREGAARGWLQRNGSWLAVWGLSLAVTFFLRIFVADVGIAGKPVAQNAAHAMPLLSEPSMILRLALKYLRLLMLPTPSRAYYTIADIPWSWLDLLAASGFVALCLAAPGRGRRRAGVLALAWVAVFLAPVVGILPFQGAALAERYLYLPSFGLVLAMSSLLGLSPRPAPSRKVFWGLAAALIALCLGLTLRESSSWRDGISLFSDLARKSPNSVKAWANLGIAYERKGMTEQETEAFARAAALSPSWYGALAHVQYGRSLLKLKRFGEAKRVFREAVGSDPRDTDALAGLGEAQLSLGEYGEAAATYELALQLKPESELLHNNLALALGSAGRWREARPHFEKAVAIRPGFGKARYNLALTLLNLGERSAALAQLEQLRSIDPALAAQLEQALR